MERQGWSRKGELDWVVLEHARAMLLVLAALVERAAGLPVVERLHFLAVMGYGEAEVRRLIVAQASAGGHGGRAGTAATLAETTDASAYNPTMGSGDAALLAARFRMLALAVDALLALAGAKPPRRTASPSLTLSRRPLLTGQTTPLPAVRATSPPAVAAAAMFFPRTGQRRSGRYWRFRLRARRIVLPAPEGDIA